MSPSKNFFFQVGLQIQILSVLSFQTVARKWRDTGGGIIMEEAWTIPELLFQVRFVSTNPFSLFSANAPRDSNTIIARGTHINASF